MEKNNYIKEPFLPDTYTAHDIYMLIQKVARLEQENGVLIKALEYYVREDDGGGKAILTLKEINEGNKE